MFAVPVHVRPLLHWLLPPECTFPPSHARPYRPAAFRFKGVRRVGPGLYQARLPPPLKQRDDGPAAVPGAGAGNPAVPGAAALPQLTPAQLQLYQQGQLLPLLGHQDGQLPSPVLPVVGAGQGVWGDEQLAQDLLPLGWDAQLWQDLAPGLDEQQQPE